MNRFKPRKLLSIVAAAAMALASVGCLPTDETVSSLVDLTASTSGSLVEIVVKALISGILTPGSSEPDLSAPISQQES